MNHRTSLLTLLIVATLAMGADAQEGHYGVVRVTDLADFEAADAADVPRERVLAMQPYVVIDGPGEAFLGYMEGTQWWQPIPQWDTARIAVRVSEARQVTGRVFVPSEDWSGLKPVAFTIEADRLRDEPSEAFQRTKLQHHERLLRHRATGAAWFRLQASEAREALGEDSGDAEESEFDDPFADAMGRDDIGGTFDLFTGQRAASEGLAIDQVLRVNGEASPQTTIDVEELEGISVDPIDWQALIEGIELEAEALAQRVPADQYLFLFPSVESALRVLEEAAVYGTPIIRRSGSGAEMMTLSRYEHQLGVDVDALGEAAAQLDIRQLALTGSDPYFGSGTDVAMIFDTGNAQGLLELLRAGAEAELTGEAGEIAGVRYESAVAEDGWRVRAYRAVLDDRFVVLSNSPVQLERIIKAHQGELPVIAELDEYTFMRHRYQAGAGEAAFLLVSDDAIRKLGSPRWRIGASRRARMLAAIEALQARHHDAIVSGDVEPQVLDASVNVPGAGELRLGEEGVLSSVYGRSPFLTPIAELPITRVSEQEAQAYGRWRGRYENRWRQWFDPIALQLTITDDRLTADMTVLPLGSGSEYSQLRELTGASTVAPHAGDGHAEAMLHYVMAIDLDAPPMVELSGLAGSFVPGLEANPLGWLGQSVSVYVDESPLWQELAAAEDPEQFMKEHASRLPVAVHAEVKSPLQLAGFLTATRAFMQQSAPGTVYWESRSHQGKPYLRVASADGEGSGLANASVYYATSPRSLTLSLDEAVLTRALDRVAAPPATQAGGAEQADVEAEAMEQREAAQANWLGKHLNLLADVRVVRVLASLLGEQLQSQAQATAWRQLPILNAWRQRYPERDPLELHEQIWGVRLVGPAGESYVWDEQWQTMASTVYGHPGEPKAGPLLPTYLEHLQRGNFGVTFEHDGLRATAQIDREAPQ
jgi:hypothetical protein